MPLYRQFSTQEELDLEYRPEARLADPAAFEAIIAERLLLSRAAERVVSRIRDVAYGPTLIERLDFYPAPDPGRPILVFIHGGYWFDSRLRKENYVWLAPALREAGLNLAVLDYAVCPDVSIEEIVRQCRAALAFLHREAGERFAADPGRLYVAGHSAGGHLAAMAALTDWPGAYGLPADLVKGACPISGLFDLAPFPHTWLQPKLHLTEHLVRRNSPLGLVRAGVAPLLVAVGAEESDEFRRQSADFEAAWRAAGNRATLLHLEGADHYAAIGGFARADSVLMRAIASHMKTCWQD